MHAPDGADFVRQCIPSGYPIMHAPDGADFVRQCIPSGYPIMHAPNGAGGLRPALYIFRWNMTGMV